MTAPDRSGEPAVTVRPATVGDVPAIVDAFTAVVDERRWLGTEPGFDRDARLALLRAGVEDPTVAVLVAEAAGEPPVLVGNLTISRQSYGVCDLGMFVVGDWRGRGVGRLLLAAAIGWARSAGAHKIALQLWPDNAAAEALYRSCGFEREGYLRRHYRRAGGEQRDAVIMGLLLDGDGSAGDAQPSGCTVPDPGAGGPP
jgi:RimJ/RimL family protein N-acetyltransferase